MQGDSKQDLIVDAFPPRSAYVHIPFCRRRCGYCNFSVVAGRDYLVDRFLDALSVELAMLERPVEVDTLYLGGGTPTQLNLQQRKRLIELLRRWLPQRAQAEFTIEANPLDLDEAAADSWRALGVNRVSLGIQSFDNRKLRTLERDHNGAVALKSLELAVRYFDNVSADLIFSVPGESLEVWKRDLEILISRKPVHVSTYSLTYEKGTTFWARRNRGQLREVDEEVDVDMFEMAIQFLNRAGFEHYEISNFAKKGRRSRHNEVYWSGRPYLAFGPGAASLRAKVRAINHRSTHAYIGRLLAQRSPVDEQENLSDEVLARDRLVFGLRKLQGIDEHSFERESGFAVEQLVGAVLHKYVQQGFLARTEGRLQLTHRGLMISDSLWPDFYGAGT